MSENEMQELKAEISVNLEKYNNKKKKIMSNLENLKRVHNTFEICESIKNEAFAFLLRNNFFYTTCMRAITNKAYF